ncbi:uncharacterized protein LOC141660447 [Apium graveolens]|uniref:uncharacterized protein LOC141660447 n=1 Tax=Apium graveolens TaxID=4045 RepID=UPI003D7B25B0
MPLSFTEEEYEDIILPHEDPLVINPIIGENKIWKVMVDGGSLTNILFHRTYTKINLAGLDMEPCQEAPLKAFGRHRIPCEAIRFTFPLTNNKAEYEALLTGLSLAKNLEVKHLRVLSDSIFVVKYFSGEYEQREPRNRAYAAKVKELYLSFPSFELSQIARENDSRADALSHLASTETQSLTGSIYLTEVTVPLIDKKQCMEIHQMITWMMPILAFLEKGTLPLSKKLAQKVRHSATNYTIINGKLYRWSALSPLLRFLDTEEQKLALETVHECICGEPLAETALAFKILRQGFHWTTLRADANQYIKKCRQSKGDVGRRAILGLIGLSNNTKVVHRRNPLRLAYGTYALLPIEVGLESHQTEVFEIESNEVGLRANIDRLEEEREAAHQRNLKYQLQAAQYYDSGIKKQSFFVGDLVLQELATSIHTKKCKLQPNWEGPYAISEVVRPGTYKLKTMVGELIKNTWYASRL